MTDTDSDVRGPGLVEALWRYRVAVVLVTLLAGAAGYGLSLLPQPLYEARSSLLLVDPRNSGLFDEDGGGDPTRYVRNQAQRIESTALAAEVGERLGSDLDLDTLKERLTAEPSEDLDLVTIRALAPTPDGAAAFADTAAEVYQDVVAEEISATAETAVAELARARSDLQARIDALDATLAAEPENAAAQAERDAAVAQLVALQSRAEQISIDAALFGSGVELFEGAEVPESPARPQPVRNGVAAALVGLLSISAFAWWRAERTQSATSRLDAAPVLRAPLLGEVPDFRSVGVDGSVPTATSPRSMAAEAYHFVAAALEFEIAEQTGGEGAATVLVTSSSPGDGKTTTAANLAVALSRDGRDIVLVDGDERRRGLSRLAGAETAPGLTDLDADGDLSDGVGRWEVSSSATIGFVPAGTGMEDSAGFFRSPRFRRAMRSVRRGGQFVVVDSPPLLAVADTSTMAGQVDGIVLVVRRGTALRVLEETRQQLEFAGAPLLGYVFNGSDVRRRGYADYDYAPVDAERARAAKPRRPPRHRRRARRARLPLGGRA